MAPADAADATGRSRELERAVRAAMLCAEELGNDAAMLLLSLRLAERSGWLSQGSCARWAALGAVELSIELVDGPQLSSLRERSGGRLPLGDPREIFTAPRPGSEWLGFKASSSRCSSSGGASAALLSCDPPLESLCIFYEAAAAEAHGRTARRRAGLYYTPPEVAAQVVELAIAHGPRLPEQPRAFDCCAGAGVFLLAAARRLAARGMARAEAGLACAGSDLDARALAVTGAVLALFAGPEARATALGALQLDPLDALIADPPVALHPDPLRPPIDLLITNPPYGHAPDAKVREELALRYPALQGGEIDLYSAFILRALELVRPGGTAALLVPDTWMTNARSSRLRAAVLERAELCAVADLGKPFAAAKDTRVQAIVLARRDQAASDRDRLHPNRSAPPARAAFTARISPRGSSGGSAKLDALAPLSEDELRARVKAGWQPYRSQMERALAAAMESASIPLGELCRVGYGLRTGNNPRHVVRGAVPEGAIPLVGGEEIEPFSLQRKAKWLRDPTPEHLRLAARQRGSPRVAIQRIRTNAAAPWARWLEAALVPAGMVCLDSLSTLAAPGSETAAAALELLWALVGLCSSVALNRYHRLQTTDVNVKPSALRTLPAPKRLLDADARKKLSTLSQTRAAEMNTKKAHLLEREIDRFVYSLYTLNSDSVEESERGFWGDRFVVEAADLERVETMDA